MSEVLDVDTHVGVAHWTMRSAPVNAIESDLLDALDDALDRALADAGVCAAVLASDLPVFSAGADA
jgi:enoyl-CoA hydratase/carnithine racemase